MFHQLQLLNNARIMLQARLSHVRKDEGGYSTEAVVVTALLTLLAIGALAVITVKVMDTANGIQTD